MIYKRPQDYLRKPLREPPDLPVWRVVNDATVRAMLGVSAQTTNNWAFRGTGPAYRKDASGHRWYVLAEVIRWARAGEADVPSADGLAHEWIIRHQREAGEAAWRLPRDQRDKALRLLGRLVGGLALDAGETRCVTDLLDAARAWPMSRKPRLPWQSEARTRTVMGYEQVKVV